MFWTALIVGVVAIGIVVFGVATGLINPNASIESFWSTVAEQSGLEYRKSGIRYTITGVVDGYEIECDNKRYGSYDTQGPAYARVQIKTDVPKALKMSTQDVDFAKSIFRSLTSTQLELGNAEFDARVKIYGGAENADVAGRVFHPGFQRLLLELLKNERVHYVLEDGVLSVLTLKRPMDGKPLKPETVSQMVKDGLRVARSLEQSQ